MVLSDASGLVLQTFGDTHAMQKAQRFALAPGNLWSESGRGTNAIGTALAIDDSCEIDGRQHFLASNRGLYCAAVPLQSPEGNTPGAGYLRPGSLSARANAGVVKGAAKQIEYLWFKQSLHPQQWLMSLHPQPEKLDGVDELLLVFTDAVLTAANRLAMREFSLNAEQFGHLTFQQLFSTVAANRRQHTAAARRRGSSLLFPSRARYRKRRGDPTPRYRSALLQPARRGEAAAPA